MKTITKKEIEKVINKLKRERTRFNRSARFSAAIIEKGIEEYPNQITESRISFEGSAKLALGLDIAITEIEKLIK